MYCFVFHNVSMFTPPHFSVTNAYISSRLAELTKCLKLTVYRLQHRGRSFTLGKKRGCRGWISIVGTSPFSRDYFPVALPSSVFSLSCKTDNYWKTVMRNNNDLPPSFHAGIVIALEVKLA